MTIAVQLGFLVPVCHEFHLPQLNKKTNKRTNKTEVKKEKMKRKN